MSVKMKGLMKGIKYNIEKFFEEEEKEMEISIGLPTDVKHVAHIGFDGPSASSPSWMNDFKGNGTESSATGDASPKKTSVRDSPGRDLPGLPRSRRQASTESIGSVDSNNDSPKEGKSRTSRKPRNSKQKENSSSPKAGDKSSSVDVPNVPKKSRKKKSEASEKKSSRSKEKGSSRHGGSRDGSDEGSVPKHSFAVDASG